MEMTTLDTRSKNRIYVYPYESQGHSNSRRCCLAEVSNSSDTGKNKRFGYNRPFDGGVSQ